MLSVAGRKIEWSELVLLCSAHLLSRQVNTVPLVRRFGARSLRSVHCISEDLHSAQVNHSVSHIAHSVQFTQQICTGVLHTHISLCFMSCTSVHAYFYFLSDVCGCESLKSQSPSRL